MGSQFKLLFPTIDDLHLSLIALGRGAYIYKVDINMAFCHLSIDPADYDLLGLYWNDAYIDTKLLFRLHTRQPIIPACIRHHLLHPASKKFGCH